ncbi:MAG TPA: polyketide synthase docking domain-containing protein [Thermoanaerobaculia bacterium]|nr:polyketide synthase docking domain-containing protein [Thermoanaerobaculia bacterium]
MTDERNAPRQALRAAVMELEDLRGRLQDLAGHLMAGEEPMASEEDQGEDEPVRAGTVVQCVILDRLEPAIRDLAGAAGSIGKAEDDKERPAR